MRRVWTWLQQPLFADDDQDRAPRWFYLALAAVAGLAALGPLGDDLPVWLPDVFDALPPPPPCGLGLRCL